MKLLGSKFIHSQVSGETCNPSVTSIVETMTVRNNCKFVGNTQKLENNAK